MSKFYNCVKWEQDVLHTGINWHGRRRRRTTHLKSLLLPEVLLSDKVWPVHVLLAYYDLCWFVSSRDDNLKLQENEPRDYLVSPTNKGLTMPPEWICIILFYGWSSYVICFGFRQYLSFVPYIIERIPKYLGWSKEITPLLYYGLGVYEDAYGRGRHGHSWSPCLFEVLV